MNSRRKLVRFWNFSPCFSLGIRWRDVDNDA